MFIFYCIAIVLIVGGVIFARTALKLNLSILLATAVIAILVPTPVYAITTAIAKNSDETFHQYYNGFETSATNSVTTCTRDGACVNEYDCDPYTVTYTVSVEDSDGKGSHTEIRTRTEYHSCPYSSQETSYYVDTTVGNYTIASNLMTGSPWRFGTAIPGGRVTQAPTFWTQVQQRIKAGKPGPATSVHDYKNYILASSTTLFKAYSDQINFYKKKNLLPTPVSGVTSFYDAAKVYTVGLPAKEIPSSYTKDVAYLDGAVGTDLQGDLHVVFVNSNKVGDSASYSNSLLAYWESKELGRDAIAKNSIIVVVGVNKYSVSKTNVTSMVTSPAPSPTPSEVTNSESLTPELKNGQVYASWVKAFTGMPLGNEKMLTQISSDLTGKPLDNSFIGRPNFNLTTNKVVHSDGKLENILYGTNRFERVSMSDLDKNDHGSGFLYLSNEWQPTTGELALIFVLSSIFMLLVLTAGTYIMYSNKQLKDPIGDFLKPSRKN